MKPENCESLYPLTVYYDGACKLCSSEIDNIAARDHADRLVLLDCNTPSFDYAELGVPKSVMLNEIHARNYAGTWLRGVDVFIAMYHAVDLGFVARLIAHPIVKPRAMAFYPWLVRNRYWLSRLGLHKIMEVFAWRARAANKRATLALANSATCKNGICLVSDKLPLNIVEKKS